MMVYRLVPVNVPLPFREIETYPDLIAALLRMEVRYYQLEKAHYRGPVEFRIERVDYTGSTARTTVIGEYYYQDGLKKVKEYNHE